MNEVPVLEEIEDAMKEMKKLAPGDAGVKRGYIRSAHEEVKSRVIEMVQKMFES